MKDQNHKRTAVTAMLMSALILLAAFRAGTVFAGSNIPVTIDIPVTYIVNGNAKMAGGDTVTLTADDPSSPMPGGTEGGSKTITIRKEGTYSFGEMYYETPGVHWYTITRNAAKKRGVTKDAPVFRAKVIALNDGHGYVLVYKDGSDEKSELVYVDKTAPATGDAGRIWMYSGMALTAGAALAAFAEIRRRNRKREAQNAYK